jgi:hypothetical protein
MEGFGFRLWMKRHRRALFQAWGDAPGLNQENQLSAESANHARFGGLT